MIIETMEVRWFWQSDKPESVVCWFDGGNGVPDRSCRPRIDYYLVLPGCRKTGIKFRENRLEVKTMVSEMGRYDFPCGLTGRVQRWVKWSTDHVPVPAGGGARDGQDRLVPVEKNRLLRRFSITGNNVDEVLSARQETGSPGHVELTRLTWPGMSGHWFTLCAEVKSQSGDQGNNLYHMLRYILSDNQKLANGLLQAESLSYPEWLVDLAR